MAQFNIKENEVLVRCNKTFCVFKLPKIKFVGQEIICPECGAVWTAALWWEKRESKRI